MKTRFLLMFVLALLLSVGGVFAQQAPISSCGVMPFDSGSLDIAIGYPQTVSSTTACVSSMTVVNTTRTPIFLVVGNADTAMRVYFNDYISPGESRTVAFGNLRFFNGVRWAASLPGLSGQMRGYK